MNYLKTAGQIMMAAAALALASSADAAEKKTIGMVFKVLNNAFTPPLQQGCAQAAKDLNVDCIFVGPTEYNEAQEVQMLQDMIQRGVDGLAVSAANPKAMAKILKQAQEKHIPVVMFEFRCPPRRQGRAPDLHWNRQLFFRFGIGQGRP